MNQKTGWIRLGCVLVLISAAGIGGFFFGKNIMEERLDKKRSELEWSQEKAEHLRKKLAVAEHFRKEKIRIFS